MTPREQAGVDELRRMMEHLDRRNAQNAGDAAELKVALAAAAGQLADVEAADAAEGRRDAAAEEHAARKAAADSAAREEYARLARLCGADLVEEDLRPESMTGVAFGVRALTEAVTALATRLASVEAAQGK